MYTTSNSSQPASQPGVEGTGSNYPPLIDFYSPEHWHVHCRTLHHLASSPLTLMLLVQNDAKKTENN